MHELKSKVGKLRLEPENDQFYENLYVKDDDCSGTPVSRDSKTIIEDPSLLIFDENTSEGESVFVESEGEAGTSSSQDKSEHSKPEPN